MTTVHGNHEITHGLKLAKGYPELVWGWGTPAGRLRALRRAEIISSAANLRPGVRALEIGCGTGMFTEMFSRTGAELLAVDISPDLLERAQERDLPTDRVQFLEKRFEDCDVHGPFDAVIGSSILHHLDVVVTLGKIYSLLKPGGLMSFAEPNMLNPQIAAQKNIPWLKERLGDTPDETAFVRHRFRPLLYQAGFENIEITPFDWVHPATPPSLMRAVTRIGLILEKIPLVREFAGSLHIRCCRPS
jgi:2-polyprenyl-3-methyl-5-hydroxy-6-metoxy-1,4-benzoquinol methylase